jgi:hypothetical protein
MMIKRLTDDPLPLDAARPGIGYPAALQQVMDRALARMPRDRYPSAVQFAHDAVAAAAGWDSATAAAPAEGATQIIGAATLGSDATVQVAPTAIRGAAPRGGTAAPPPRPAPTPTTPRPITSPPAPARKKRGPVLTIAALVVVGSGAAAMMLLKGGDNGGLGPDTLAAANGQVTGDTARQVPRPPDSGRPRGTNPPTPAQDTGGTQIPPVATVDSSAIATELGNLLDQSLEAATKAAARTRALAILGTETAPPNLRAEAAAIAANVSADDGDMTQACRLMGQARGLAPGKASYQASMTAWGCRS